MKGKKRKTAQDPFQTVELTRIDSRADVHRIANFRYFVNEFEIDKFRGSLNSNGNVLSPRKEC